MKPFLPISAIAFSSSVPAATFPSRLYANADEQGKHCSIIERLAEETGRPVWQVEPLYEDILADLKAKASIQDYLPILVSKKVKYLLKN